MDKFKPYLPQNASAHHSENVVHFEVAAGDILSTVENLHSQHGLALKAIEATDERKNEKCFKIWYVFGVPEDNLFIVPFIRLEKTQDFPSITPTIHAAGQYERKIQAFFGLNPVGNPDNRRIILHENWPEGVFPLRKDFKLSTRPKPAKSTFNFQKVEGEGIYEIPVGPIHAGIIEPGHFRFSVAGESIMLLEARLGYVHKGHEKLFENLELPEQIRLSEKISGDSSFSHSLAFCQAIERLTSVAVPQRAAYLRTIYAELERLANHLGDIGAIMLDTGFNFGGGQGPRLREIVMCINERLTGSRFLRGVNTVGGVTKDIPNDQRDNLARELTALLKDFSEVIDIADDSASLQNRLKTAGPLAIGIARDYGVVGVAARAAGILTDARAEHPYAAYGKLPPQAVAYEQAGDVHARFRVRIQEVHTSVATIKDALAALPAGNTVAKPKAIMLPANSLAIGCVEGWRGEIIHFLKTDNEGQISRVAVRDPSFINWQIMQYCGLGQIVPDFPLINKSLNLSYTGNDL